MYVYFFNFGLLHADFCRIKSGTTSDIVIKKTVSDCIFSECLTEVIEAALEIRGRSYCTPVGISCSTACAVRQAGNPKPSVRLTFSLRSVFL